MMGTSARARTKSLRTAKQPKAKRKTPARVSGWGGARPGAGRKPGPRPKTPHRARPLHVAGRPLHVTLRAAAVPLGTPRVLPEIQRAVAAASARAPNHFRIVAHTVEHDHVDLVVQAKTAEALSSGMRSVSIRIARAVNDCLGRSGPLWGDRWHARVVKAARARS